MKNRSHHTTLYSNGMDSESGQNFMDLKSGSLISSEVHASFIFLTSIVSNPKHESLYLMNAIFRQLTKAHVDVFKWKGYWQHILHNCQQLMQMTENDLYL